MTLLVCGINHLTTPLEIRERLAFSKERTKSALKELVTLSSVNEAMIVSTCNRVEIYSHAQRSEEIRHWLEMNLKQPVAPCWYFYQEQEAITHIMRVASGLDSMVLGEPHILGQIKDFFCLAKEMGAIGNHLHQLFQRVFNVSKQVRTSTQIGANPVTLGFAIVTLARRIFTHLSTKKTLLIGAGETIELIALHLQKQGVKHFTLANRSPLKAKQLAEKIKAHCISLAEIPDYLKESDLIITATASELPILGKGALERTIKARKHQPIVIADLAVPRDVEPEVGSLEDVYLYNIDDLNLILEENRQGRQIAAAEAESLIELQAKHYLSDLKSREADHLITHFRQKIADTFQLELAKAKSKLHQGVDPEILLEQMAYNLVNKISHGPSIKMRQAAYEGRIDLLDVARQLLDLA